MEEIVRIPVIVGEDEKELEFGMTEDNVIIVKLDNKEICRCDWDKNLKEGFERMLEIWKTEEKEE